MSSEEFQKLVKEANERFNALTPEEQKAHREAQRESWVRGEMALSKLVKKHIGPNGEIIYDDYESYCLD
jgi:hypothetical protein